MTSSTTVFLENTSTTPLDGSIVARTFAVLPKFLLYAEISADSIAEQSTSLLMRRSLLSWSSELKNSSELMLPFAMSISSPFIQTAHEAYSAGTSSSRSDSSKSINGRTTATSFRENARVTPGETSITISPSTSPTGRP